MAGRNKTRISDLDEKYFKEIFNLNGEVRDGHTDKRIDHAGLNKIFEMVGFEPNAKQAQEFKEMFEKEDTMNFRQFLDIFSLKSNPEFNQTDVKNAFRLLSKEYTRDGMIQLDRVKEILTEIGISDLEIVQLTTQLQPLVDKDGYFNFEEFVDSAF